MTMMIVRRSPWQVDCSQMLCFYIVHIFRNICCDLCWSYWHWSHHYWTFKHCLVSNGVSMEYVLSYRTPLVLCMPVWYDEHDEILHIPYIIHKQWNMLSACLVLLSLVKGKHKVLPQIKPHQPSTLTQEREWWGMRISLAEGSNFLTE